MEVFGKKEVTITTDDERKANDEAEALVDHFLGPQIKRMTKELADIFLQERIKQKQFDEGGYFFQKCFHACQNAFIRVLTKALSSQTEPTGTWHNANEDTREKISIEARFLADKMVELGQESFARHIRTVCNGGGYTEVKDNEL